MVTTDKWILGIDIGGTNVRVGQVATDYSLSGFEMMASAHVFSKESQRVQELALFVRNYCATHTGCDKPSAVCIGFPATLNRERTRVISSPNLHGFNALDIVTPLTKLLGVPVFIDRDVNLILKNDIASNNLFAAETVLGCYFGTGLGNAICINGKMLLGKNGVAGELGHAPVFGSVKACGCGNKGCMETVFSGRYLEELGAQFFQGEPIHTLFHNHADSAVLKEYVEGLAIPIATEVNVLDPDYVVLGGGVLQMNEFPLDLLKEAVLRHTRKPLPYQNLQIFFSQQNQESGVIGAGMVGFEHINKKI